MRLVSHVIHDARHGHLVTSGTPLGWFSPVVSSRPASWRKNILHSACNFATVPIGVSFPLGLNDRARNGTQRIPRQAPYSPGILPLHTSAALTGRAARRPRRAPLRHRQARPARARHHARRRPRARPRPASATRAARDRPRLGHPSARSILSGRLASDITTASLCLLGRAFEIWLDR